MGLGGEAQGWHSLSGDIKIQYKFNYILTNVNVVVKKMSHSKCNCNINIIPTLIKCLRGRHHWVIVRQIKDNPIYVRGIQIY